MLGYLASVIALLTPTGSAIAPAKGIDGIRWGMSRAAVERVLGTADRVVGDHVSVYDAAGLRVQILHDVTAIRTSSARYRTAGGVGVGSTVGQLRAAVTHLRCGLSRAGTGTCERRDDGHTVTILTSFEFKRHRVVSVVVRDGPVIPAPSSGVRR